jgi:PadR family transcriptional regulator, regulatory protein AphA
MREGKTRYVILGLLGEGPMSGYTIKKLVDVRFRFFWSESYGQLYPELKALLREGLVMTLPAGATLWSGISAHPPKAGHRDRIVYAIAPTGRKVLREWLARPAERESVRFEILLKMYFSGLGDPGLMVPHLKEFEMHYAAELSVLRRFQEELERIPDDGGNHRDILRVIDFGQKTYEAYLAWSRKTLSELEGR